MSTPDHMMLSFAWPTAALILAVLLGAAGWVALHWLDERVGRRVGRLLILARVAVGFVTLMLLWQVLMRWVHLATPWPLWSLAALGAVAAETVGLLYDAHLRQSGGMLGRAMVPLRVAAILLIVLMLAQPVWSIKAEHGFTRVAAVLVDTSPSMQIADRQMPPGEKLRLAVALGSDVQRRGAAYEPPLRDLADVRATLAAAGEFFGMVASADEAARDMQLAQQLGPLNDRLGQADGELAEVVSAIRVLHEGDAGKTLPKDLRKQADDIVTTIEKDIRPSVVMLHGWTATPAEATRRNVEIRRSLADALAAADRAAELGRSVTDRLDAWQYEKLPPDARKDVDALAEATRLELARRVLTNAAEKGGLLATIRQAGYDVKLWSFNSAATAISGDAPPASKAVSLDAAAAAEPGGTDLAEAMQAAMSDIDAKRLAGMIILSDGRDNAGKRPELPARRLGTQGIAVSTIVMGAGRPPLDAAVAGLTAPDTVILGDRLAVEAEIKLDALKGKKLKVRLMEGEKTLDETTVQAADDAARLRVRLSHEPKETRLHEYRVEVDAVDGEVSRTNNAQQLAVGVTDDRTRLLIVDSWPRWEYRYLKNLFAARDNAVQLQHVLLNPDRVAGAPASPVVHASAARPKDQPEANALPASEEEWLKFDVIVLGDISPQQLGPEAAATLGRFVLERGGTLVVIAGRHYMPHAYRDTPLAELLPMRLRPGRTVDDALSKDGYRLVPTAEGRQHVIMQQDAEGASGADVWQEAPAFYWRHPALAAKPSARVLAYSLDADAPSWIRDQAEPQPDARQAEARRQYQSDHALLALQHLGVGRILMFSFDRTWRLRYRQGDTYHHRFWGQVVRWATAEKISGGTERVRLSTHRKRYGTAEPVVVRAKLIGDDYAPIRTDNIAVKLYRVDADGKAGSMVARKAMRLEQGAAAIYRADLETLPAGRYRVELDSPAATDLLAGEETKVVTADFAVDGGTRRELVELTPDRGLLGRLAGMTGGVMLDPQNATVALDRLATPSEVLPERRQVSLWDSWPLMLLIFAVATAEWLIRRKETLP